MHQAWICCFAFVAGCPESVLIGIRGYLAVWPIYLLRVLYPVTDVTVVGSATAETAVA